MDAPPWREHRLVTADGAIAWYDAGSGPTLVLLHGGPGDDHRYLRPLADLLTARFRCVLPDQRGSGNSRLDRADAETLHVERFVADVETLREHLGLDRLALAGHSWGANLALLYATRHPDRIAKLALLGLGPLDEGSSAVAGANLLQPLSAPEREVFAALRADRRAALAVGDLATHADLHVRLVAEFYVRGWFFSPVAAARFADDYRAHYAHNPLVSRFLLPSVNSSRLWTDLPRVTAPVLVLYGHQDFEPIVQAYLLRERMPDVRVCLLNECGHVPWLEQPLAVQQTLEMFFGPEP